MFSLPHPPALTSLSRAGMLQVKTYSLHIFFLGFLFIALLASPRNARCRIGETFDECKARYGTPVSIQKDAALFLKNGMTVSVHFIAGKVDQIIYRILWVPKNPSRLPKRKQ